MMETITVAEFNKRKQSVTSYKKSGSWKRDFLMNGGVYLMAIPVVAYFFIFNYLPMFGLSMAFQDYSPRLGTFGSPFVGFKHFKEFFTGETFWQLLRNTVVMSGLDIVIVFPLTIVFALLLDEIKQTKIKKVFQTISYLPYFISIVIVCTLIREFCMTNGVVTDICVFFGMERQNMLMNPDYFWGINLVSNIWQNLGYSSIIFIAAISAVNSDLHEAAMIDGAGRFKRVIHVTIPAIMPTIITMLILKSGSILSMGFEKVLLLYNPSIYSTADVISSHVQRFGISMGQYSYATAVGLFNSVVGTIMLLITNFISKKFADTSIV